MTNKVNKQSAFTLIELLVVIAIIGILSSVVLASLSGARESAKVTKMVSDFQQIETGMIMWMDAKGKVQWPNESNLSINQVKNDGYLNSLPASPFGTGYTYNNNDTTFSCGQNAGRGVYIYVDVQSAPQDAMQEIQNILDGDGNPDCGKVRYNGQYLRYSLSNDGNL